MITTSGALPVGHWLKYDADAAQRSVFEARDFLAAQLTK